MRVAVDGDCALLHGLQQSRLGFGRRSVDFIGQQESAKYRAFNQRKFIGLQIKYLRSGNIGWHQIGCKLNPRKIGAHHMRKGSDQQCFGNARHAFNQCVGTGKNGN